MCAGNLCRALDFSSCHLGEYLGSDPGSDLGSISQDAGTLDFNNYLKYLTLDDDVPEEERERCKAAWKEGIAQARPRRRRSVRPFTPRDAHGCD